MDAPVFRIFEPVKGPVLPLVVSVPHCGTAFPHALVEQFRDDVTVAPDDTDWFVDRLYDFVPQLGGTLICAHYSRYVIDLNRSANNVPLYGDGRVESSLLPTETFSGEMLYRQKPTPALLNVNDRLNQYYWPYYEAIERRLQWLQDRHDHVLLFEGHSIRRYVPAIRSMAFPDLMLGTVGGQSAHHRLIQTSCETLRANSEGYSVSVDDPFQGGNLTRYFGYPQRKQHALQLEMCQDLYMDEKKNTIIPERFNRITALLRPLLQGLADATRDLK